MKTIIFIGANKSGSSRDAIHAALKLGYFTILFTNRERFLEQRREFSEVHQMIPIDIRNLESMRETIRFLQDKQSKKIKAVVSFLDSYVYNAAVLSREFCSTASDLEIINKMTDKIETRRTLQESDYNPFFMIYDGKESTQHVKEKIKGQSPFIVKTPRSTGSKNVLTLNSVDELLALKTTHSQGPLLIEEYLQGPQYLVETLVVEGKVHIVATFEQEILTKPRFIVTGYGLCMKMPPKQYKTLTTAVESIIKTFGLKNGACHLELRFIEGDWKLIEINPRISGGVMNSMIESAYGINLAEETLKLALGYQPSLKRKYERWVYAHYITAPEKGVLEKVTGKAKASRYPGVLDVYIKPRKGHMLQMPTSMGYRYAYVLATGSSQYEAKHTAKEAAKEIEFHVK